MAEVRWPSSNPSVAYRSLQGRASDRKMRLFACAACRQVWGRLADRRSRRAVEVAEKYADGETSRRALRRAQLAMEVHVEASPEECQAWDCCEPDAAAAAGHCLRPYPILAPAVQVTLLRDIFGDPFRAPAPLPPAVLAWNDGTVKRIAEGVYQERQLPAGMFDTGRLAILADALLDAGCDNEELLAHCRSAGPHVRGCWAIDAILAKS
jgi:hypothetical protein